MPFIGLGSILQGLLTIQIQPGWLRMETGIAHGSVRGSSTEVPQTDVKQGLTSILLLHQSRTEKILAGFARTK
jgi:hypothetical protein